MKHNKYSSIINKILFIINILNEIKLYDILYKSFLNLEILDSSKNEMHGYFHIRLKKKKNIE